jgi:hypothetical protein
MIHTLRRGLFVAALIVATPGVALAAGCTPCPTPVVTTVEAGASMIYVEWSSDVADVVDFTVVLDQLGRTVDEQTVSADVNAASFFGVAEGSDYSVSVTANTATDAYSSSPSESVSVTESYVFIDPPVRVTTKLDPTTVTLALSEDESTWIVSIPTIDQGGQAGIYGVTTSDGSSCWAFSASDNVEGDVVSCGIEALDPLVAPEVTAAYYEEDYVMYAMRAGGIATTTLAGTGESLECSVTTSDDNVDDCVTIDPRDIPTPFDDVVMTSSAGSSTQPGVGVSFAVAALGLIAIVVVMRPRRRTSSPLVD